MAQDNKAIEDALGQAAIWLASKGFLQQGDTLSQLVPEQGTFAEVRIPASEPEMAFRWTNLSATPAGLHHRIYSVRPDVGAILSGALPWTGALGRMNLSIPPVFDEQIRHLGVEVSRLAMRSVDDGPIRALFNGANAYALDDLSLCFGMGLERLMANVEILEKCAESYVLARLASRRVKRIPWLIKYIANGRLRKDQTDAATRHLRGERAVMKAGY